jgi:hypothetical protein
MSVNKTQFDWRFSASNGFMTGIFVIVYIHKHQFVQIRFVINCEHHIITLQQLFLVPRCKWRRESSVKRTSWLPVKEKKKNWWRDETDDKQRLSIFKFFPMRAWLGIWRLLSFVYLVRIRVILDSPVNFFFFRFCEHKKRYVPWIWRLNSQTLGGCSPPVTHIQHNAVLPIVRSKLRHA